MVLSSSHAALCPLQCAARIVQARAMCGNFEDSELGCLLSSSEKP